MFLIYRRKCDSEGERKEREREWGGKGTKWGQLGSTDAMAGL